MIAQTVYGVTLAAFRRRTAHPGATGPGTASPAKRAATASRRLLALTVCGIVLSAVSMPVPSGTTGSDCAGISSDTSAAAERKENRPDSGSRAPRPMKRLDASQRKELLEAIEARTGDTGGPGAGR